MPYRSLIHLWTLLPALAACNIEALTQEFYDQHTRDSDSSSSSGTSTPAADTGSTSTGGAGSSGTQGLDSGPLETTSTGGLPGTSGGVLGAMLGPLAVRWLGAAAEAREKALRQFEQLIEGSRLPPARMAEAEVERGKLLYQSGDREQALEAFRRAGELTPGDEGGRGSGQIYVDILAYLVPRGEVDEVVATYHRALGRVRLPESMKVYCSLWVTDLLVRGGQPVDPMAAGVLAAMQGTKWHMDLARWSNGKLTDAELLQLADTAGRQAEANFYIGMARLRAGDKRQAEAQWRKVVDSHMLGYFEYEMASQYLRLGKAPVTPVAPLKAQPRPKLPPSNVPRPRPMRPRGSGTQKTQRPIPTACAMSIARPCQRTSRRNLQRRAARRVLHSARAIWARTRSTNVFAMSSRPAHRVKTRPGRRRCAMVVM